MLESMTFDDFLNWRAFDLIEPFGDRRADYHAASICAAMFNATLMSKGSKKRVRVSDFLLEFRDAEAKIEEEQASSAGWQRMKWIAKMHVAVSKTTKEKPTRRVQKPARDRKK
jgi:hypothetical protein